MGLESIIAWLIVGFMLVVNHIRLRRVEKVLLGLAFPIASSTSSKVTITPFDMPTERDWKGHDYNLPPEKMHIGRCLNCDMNQRDFLIYGDPCPGKKA